MKMAIGQGSQTRGPRCFLEFSCFFGKWFASRP